MPDKVTDALARPADDASRFEALEQLLNSPEHRSAFEDFIEEAIRRESGEVAAKMLARTRFFAELVEREGKKLEGADQTDAINILEREFKSILDAASRALGHENEGELLLPFAKYLAAYLESTGRWREALSLYERIVERASAGDDDALYAQALISYGVLQFGLSNLRESEEALTRAKSISEKLGDIAKIARATSILGNLNCVRGKYQLSIALQEESLRLRREIGDPRGIASCLANLATVYCQIRQFEKAIQLFEESLKIDRETGDQRGVAVTLNNLGNLAQQQGLYDEAHKSYSEADGIFRKVGDRHGLAMTTGNLGLNEYFRRNTPSARNLTLDALELNREIGDEHGVALSLGNLGCIALLDLQLEHARRHFESSLEVFQKIGLQTQVSGKLAFLALVDLAESQRITAWKRLHGSLLIWKSIREHNEICFALLVASRLLLEVGLLEPAAIIQFSYQSKTQAVGLNMGPLETNCSDLNASVLNDLLPEQELDGLKAQGEKMSFEDLIDYALKALEELKPELVDTAADSETAQESADI